MIEFCALYGAAHIVCSLYRSFGPNGDVKKALIPFAADYKYLAKRLFTS